VQLLGVLASQQTVADDRVFIDPHESAGFANADPLGNVLEDGDHFVLGQAGVEEGSALSLGKTGLAAPAIKQSALLGAVPATHREIAVPAFAVVGAVLVLTAKNREVIHGNNSLGSIQGVVKGVQLL
jgi:hypothetical protein